MAATLDHVSNGRFILGIGSGWHRPEFDALGLPFDHRVARLEEAVGHVTAHWAGQTGLRQVALAGGVALNCVANGLLIRHGVEALYVQPAAGDEGTAIGAALHVVGQRQAPVSIGPMPFWGPEAAGPAGSAHDWIKLPSADVAAAVASRLLAAGAITTDDTIEIDGRHAFAVAAACRHPQGSGPRLLFQHVPEPKTVKDRISSKLDKTVYIKADARAKYGDVVGVVDQVRAAGVDQLGLLTEKVEQRAPGAPPGALTSPAPGA